MSNEISISCIEHMQLPVCPHVHVIADTLMKSKTLVLTAETGAGKSTVVPAAIQALFGGSIVMLEPRRAAALAAACRIADIIGEKPGHTVGYAVRHETCVSKQTKITVMTEALLQRRMMSDPFLDDISVVILDEFHERSIYADSALAFLLEIREVRSDLCILIMSATLQAQKLTSFLSCPVYAVPGRCFPVSVSYKPVILLQNSDMPYREWALICAAEFFDDNHMGAILVFLPGMREIMRLTEELRRCSIPDNAIMILHGSLSVSEQRRVLVPPQNGTPRIILASAVAETSITVPDVTVVIDSGLSRINRFMPQLGMNHLVTERVTHASAEQRRGRAGRIGPGRCIRLWPEHERLLENVVPEIMRTDLTELVLSCAQRGVTEYQKLRWLDSPPDGAWNQAKDVLVFLGALTPAGAVTSKGMILLQMPCNVRIGAVALSNKQNGPHYAAMLDAIMHTSKNATGNLLEETISVDQRTESDIRSAMQTWTSFPENITSKASMLASGFPDRIAKKCAIHSQCDTARYTFFSGRIAKCGASVGSVQSDYIVCIDADAGNTESLIYSYVPLTESEARTLMNPSIKDEVVLIEDESSGSFKTRRRHIYGAIILDESPVQCDKAMLIQAYIRYIQKKGLSYLLWSKKARGLYDRLAFYAAHGGTTQLYDDETLLRTLDTWLAPFMCGTTKEPCSEQNVYDALAARAGYQVLSDLGKKVPEFISVPSGRMVRIDYQNHAEPVLAVKVQEMFGCRTTPLVMNIPILLHLLSPSQSPVQITRDLAHFWETTWHDVVKDMRGKYPKHPWPDNPYEIQATAKTKRQLEKQK